MGCFDFDDFGCSKVISNTCQTRDCRDKLDELHYFRPEFKVTLFTVPAQMTYELAEWCSANKLWVSLAVHGFYHGTNYECADWTKQQCLDYLDQTEEMFPDLFVKGFKSPGWQTSDGVFEALAERGYWISCQSYDADRIPENLPAYVNHDGEFIVHHRGTLSRNIPSLHGHTWSCMGNGIEETFDTVKETVKRMDSFQFVGEAIKEFVSEIDSSEQ